MELIQLTSPKTGLVLEGGGFRGTYTSGVLDAMIDNGILFPYVIGVSAGVCNAVSYFSAQSGRGAVININHCNDKRYYGIGNYLKTGSIFGEKMMFDVLPHQLYPYDYEAYQKRYTKLVAVTTDCDTGKPAYYEVNDLKNQYILVKASSWLPYVSKMVEHDGKRLLDGGVSDSIPFEKAFVDGCEKVVVVLTQPRDYQKQPSSGTPLAKLMYRKYPKLIDALTNRHVMYNKSLRRLEELEQQGKAIVLAPKAPLGISRLEKNPEKLKEAQRIGYQDGIELLNKLIPTYGIESFSATNYNKN